MKRLLLLGGGHAHIEVLRRLALAPLPGVAVTLVTPRPLLPYTGMLPGCIAGHYKPGEIVIDLAGLARRAGASLKLAEGRRIDPGERVVACSDGEGVGYDVLSCDIGSRPPGGTEGVREHAIEVRPLEKVLDGFEALLVRVRQGEVHRVLVVGGGAGGVELAFAMHHRFQVERGPQAPSIAIVTDTPRPLPEFPERARRMLRALAGAKGLGSHVGSRVARVDPAGVQLENGEQIAADATFWVAGAGAHPLFREAGMAVDDRGFLSVDACLQSLSHPGVFGAGDCATHVADPRPKAGVFAVRAGPPLDRNLRAALRGEPLHAWRPQRRYLALLSTGDRHAIGTWGPFAWQGDWAWRWKDRIDRAFLSRYRG